MACIPLPAVALPVLPAPFSIDPPELPAITIGAEFCCKLPTLSVTPLIPIPAAILNPAVIALINAASDVINAYIDALPLDCPRE